MTQRRGFYLVLLIIGLGFALRTYQLDARPFWFDEGLTVDLAAAPGGYVIDTIDRPPVYYLLMHEWTALVGASPFALRFFSAWWGTLALAFFYLLARQLLDRRLSVWALLLATFSPFYVRYAQEARTYSLTLTLALISCWAMLVWLKHGRTRYLVLNAAATLGCLYTHYSLLLLPAAQGLFVLLTTWRDVKRSQGFFAPSTTFGLNFFAPLPHHLPKSSLKLNRLWQWIIVQGIAGLLFLPWPLHAWRGLPELIAPQAEPSPFTAWQQGANFTSTTLLEFSAGQPLGWPIGETIALVYVGLIVLGLLSPVLPKLSRRCLAILLLLPTLIMLLLPRTSVYYAPKYLMMITPAFYILTVVGVEALWQARTQLFNRRVAAALGVMLIIGVPVLLIGRAAMQPFQADKTVQSFWADDLHKPSAIDDFRNVAFADEGATLSQLQVLPPKAYSLMGIDASGKIHLRSSYEDSLLYDPKSGATQTSSGPHLEGMFYNGYSVMAPDGRWYSLMGIEKLKGNIHLTQFDPATSTTRGLSSVISTTRYLLVDPDDQVYGFTDSPWPIFKYDPSTDVLTPLTYPSAVQLPGDVKYNYRDRVVIGYDGWLYGTMGYYVGTIYAVNLTSGEIITRTMSVSALTPRRAGGVYVNSGQNFWIFDASGTLTPLPAPSTEIRFYSDFLVLRSDGHLIGKNPDYQTPYFFDYDPATGAFQRLHSNAYALSDRFMSAPNNALYTTYVDHLAVIDSGQYSTTGQIHSQIIRPAALSLTDTIVGGNIASVAALACGQNGKVYGVKSDPATSKWLFEYDPQQPETPVRQITPNTLTGDKGKFLAGTVLVPLSDGRLVGGTNNGHLFVYTPTTDETWDVGQPAQDTQQIASLAVNRAGTIYGGTLSYEHRAALFSFDPVSGTIGLIDLPIVDPTLIGAVTVGPEDRVYAGVDRILVAYDPRTQQTTIVKVFDYDQGLTEPATCTIRTLIAGPDGQIYGGCGSHLFAYDPAHNSVHDLGTTQELGSIASLTLNSDGRIYGSVEHEYMSRSSKYRTNKIFVYAPAEQRMINLGMAVQTGPVILAACGTDTIYGGSNTTNSNYSGPAYLFAFRADCPQGVIGSWDKVTWQAQTPPGTRLTVDVMSNYSTALVRNIENGGSLQAIDAQKNPQLMLRANLFTSDPSVTPVLQSWRVDYSFACNNQPRSGQP